MAKQAISFIVPLRGRREQIPGFVYNIKQYYKDFEILFCVQDDNLLFKKGQLSNLGYKKAKYDILAFINLDYRFLSFVDILKEMEEVDQPLCTFSYQARITEEKPGRITIVRKPLFTWSMGGCTVFTRKQWEDCCGNSNLIFGWGPDDVLLQLRTNFRRLEDTMGHLVHKKENGYNGIKVIQANRRIKAGDIKRDKTKDGFRQTLAEEAGRKELGKNIFEYKFKNIKVPNDFAYMDLYNQQLELERRAVGSTA